MLGLTGYYNKFIPPQADLVQPLTQLTCKQYLSYGLTSVKGF